MSQCNTFSASVEPTAEDWAEYAAWAEENDRAWLASLNDGHHTTEPTPLSVLADGAPFDLDVPMPDHDLDALYSERQAEAFGTFGHPAWEV